MPPLHVLHVIGGLELGGAETLLYRLATNPSSEFEHEVVCLGSRDWYSPRLEQQGIEVHHLGITSPLSSVRGIARLRRIIRECRPDLIQSWMYLANTLSSLSAGRTPVVWGIHGSTLEHLGAPSFFCARAAGVASRRLADFVINCSERSAELHSKLGYSAVSNAVIHNGYDPNAFFPDGEKRAATRRALAIEGNTFLAGSITRWHSQKDIPNLLKALRLAADEVPLRCMLIGRGMDAENEELRAEILRQRCEGLVVLLGARADVQDLARTLDLHILSSSGGEAFPNVVAETMLSGTPNVVTDVGDSALMVGETGWAVAPSDPPALAGAIVEAAHLWSTDKRGWQDRGVAARSQIAERYTFDCMVKAYQEVWTRVAERPQISA